MPKVNRDLLQDLRDVADGLEVVHAVDLKKEQVAKKRESRQRRRGAEGAAAE